MNPSLPFNSPAHALSWLKRANLCGTIEAPRMPDRRYPQVNLTPSCGGIKDQGDVIRYKDAIVCLSATHSFNVTYRD